MPPGGGGKWRRTAPPEPGPNDEREKALSPLLRPPPDLPNSRIYGRGRGLGRLGTELPAETPPAATPSGPKFHGGGNYFISSPAIPRFIGMPGAAKKGGTATQPTQVGDVRHMGSLCGPIHGGNDFPQGSRRSAHRRKSRLRPRHLAQNIGEIIPITGPALPSSALCIPRRSMHLTENDPHAPGLGAWFYEWGKSAPGPVGRDRSSPAVGPIPHRGEWQMAFSPRTPRRRRSDFCL